MSRASLSLNFMHCMERFATQIYLTQRGSFKDAATIRKLEEASLNEASHVTRLKERLDQLNLTVIPAGFLFQFMGAVVGLVTRLLGPRNLWAADVWVEKRAVQDYGSFIKKVRFDARTINLIQTIITEEYDHIHNWSTLRRELTEPRAVRAE